MSQFFSWQKKSGEPIKTGGFIVTPQSQVLEVRLPFGGFVWHRPVSVVVEREGEVAKGDGRESQIIPITDVTRQALWAISGLAILVNLLFLRKRK